MHIEILEAALQQSATEGWRLSRDKSQIYSYAELETIDAPVNDLPSALLSFTGFTILEREIFFSARDHVAWARTSRVDDIRKFTVPPELQHPVHEVWRELMTHGVQDDYRMHLPLVAHTAWVARMSVRALIKMARYFAYLSWKMEDKVLSTRFLDVSAQLFLVRRRMGYDNKLLTQTQRYLHEHPIYGFNVHTVGDVITNVHTVGDVITLIEEIPFALRAQIARHKEIILIDDLFSRISRSIVTKNLGTKLRVSMTATRAAWQQVLSHRACWIAQTDLWAPIIQALPVDQVLPCADGACRFEADAKARLVPGNDPNAPCPRYMNLNNLDKSNWRAAMMQAATLRSGNWKQEVEQ